MPPIFSPTIRRGIKQRGQFAKLAGYDAAIPNRQYAAASRIGTNPNSVYSQIQRVRLSMEGEQAIKNMPAAVNYVAKRTMYCSGSIKYSPNTGNASLDEEVSQYLSETFRKMGNNGQSMEDVFTLAGDVMLPEKGDCALQWYRDIYGMRLVPISADRIGEQYSFTSPAVFIDGEQYSCGLFTDGLDTTGYRIYDLVSESMYVNPHRVEPWDLLFFKDPLNTGLRGVSAFFAALLTVNKANKILQFTMDSMQAQAKTAIVSSNNSGMPADYAYQAEQSLYGGVEYVESYADGAVERFVVNGDSYTAFKPEQPTTAFINGLRYLGEEIAQALRFPYGFLFNGAGSGGAPFRGDFEVAGKEIERIRNRIHRPKLDIISYVTIMDAVERKKLPPRKNITRGEWRFGSLPSVDAFRDEKADIMKIRAGTDTRDGVIKRNGGIGFQSTVRESKKEAVMIAMAAQDANRELKALGYEETVTVNDIAQSLENPQVQQPYQQQAPVQE